MKISITIKCPQNNFLKKKTYTVEFADKKQHIYYQFKTTEENVNNS